MESDYEPKMSNTSSIMEKGYGEFGCSHYRGRCKIRAPCCDEIFDCRHCHNESKVQQHCNNCGVCMGNYFCSKCNFFDDEVSKNQYHCNECGICRIGGEENFFFIVIDVVGLSTYFCVFYSRDPYFLRSPIVGCCYSKTMKHSHNCVKKALHHNCAICFEFLFDTTKDITVLPCGHTIHLECVKEMERHFLYSCPVCSKSYCDMSRAWGRLGREVASTTMHQTYQNKMVWILCNDCGENSEVNFHILARKCLKCSSYNTRQTRGVVASCLSDIAEIVR